MFLRPSDRDLVLGWRAFFIAKIVRNSRFSKTENRGTDKQCKQLNIIFGRHDKRNRGYGRILHAIRRTGATGKAQLLERNAAAYFIGLSERKRDRF